MVPVSVRVRFIVFTLLFFVASSFVRAAEVTTATIAGRVAASGETSLADVDVDAASPSGRYHTRTTADGRYIFLNVAPDTYTLAFARAGYEGRALSGITVLPGARASGDVTLVRNSKRSARRGLAPRSGAAHSARRRMSFA